MKLKKLLFPTLTLLLAVMACSLPGSTPVVTSPAVTDLPGTEPLVTEPAATEPPLSGVLLPAGFITSATNGAGLVEFTFHDTSGAVTGTVGAASLQNANTENVFPIGGVGADALPELVYYTFNGYNLLLNNNGVESLLANLTDFYSMTGVPAQAIIAYGTADLTGSGLTTSLFIGPPATATSSGPVLTYTDESNGAIIPLYIRMEGGTPAGVWFTQRIYGIGGDLVFDPSSGLFNLDLASGTVNELTLPGGIYSPSLSSGGDWLAYNDQGIGSASNLNIRQLTTGESHSFALLADSDRGAGDGVFSPGGLHLAWMEGHGWIMAETPDFRPTVRLGASDGTLLGDYPAVSFEAAAGFSVSFAHPLGWLDEQTVLVQVTGSDWTQAAVLSLSLEGGISLLASGNFVDFTYP